MKFCTKCGTDNQDENSFCTKCGTPLLTVDTDNKPNKKKTLTIVLVIVSALAVLAIILFGYVICLNHDWSEATCIEPAKCNNCEKYKDDVLGNHKWNEATCTMPKTCSLCEVEEGKALGHNWQEATCTEPQTCLICYATKGEPLGHISEWSESDIDYKELTSVKTLVCNSCEEVLETKSEPVTSFVDGDHFIIYPAKFADRFEESSVRLNNTDYYTKEKYNEYGFYDEDNTVFYRIQDCNDSYSDIGMMSFTKPDGKTVAVMNNYSENCIGCINILIGDSYDATAIIYSAVLAIDPNIGYMEAGDVTQSILDNVATNIGEVDESDFVGIDYNGINYLFFRDREYHYLVISIAS